MDAEVTDPDRGVVFPAVDGARSTSAAGRAVFAEAARAVDPALAADIEADPQWRKGYLVHARRLVEADVVATDPVAVPRAGLAALEQRFEFLRDGTAVPLPEALSLPPATPLDTATIAGTGEPARRLEIPYRGRLLAGDDLRRQADAWVTAGTVEPSFATALRRVVDHPDWLDLSDVTFVALGAGAEMGPVPWLAAWGARVVAIDLPRPPLWRGLLPALRAGSGTTLIPVRTPAGADDRVAEAAGADLTTELPEVAAWLDEVASGPMVVGSYVYAAGADNVRVAVAADALTTHLLAQGDVTVAGLLTPTDVYAVPEEAVTEARRRFERRGAGARLAATVTARRGFAPNYTDTLLTAGGVRVGIGDGLIAQQGPNYALAKRLQRWRLRVARADGARVSANIAPSTRTRSVVRNRVLAAAYAGAHRFGVEVFEPATSVALMAALLVHDLRQPGAAGDPTTDLAHPLALFSDAAAHGGLWRQPYAPRSVLPLAAALGWPKGR